MARLEEYHVLIVVIVVMVLAAHAHAAHIIMEEA